MANTLFSDKVARPEVTSLSLSYRFPSHLFEAVRHHIASATTKTIMVPNVVQQAAQADLYGIVGRAAVLGILFHMSIQAVEFEKIMFHYLAALPVVAVLMSTVFVVHGPCGWLEAVAKSFLFESVFNTSCLLSISIYRVLFHRCKNFPGPLGVKISRFWTAYISAKNIQYYKELDKFQSTYGDFVRTGKQRQLRICSGIKVWDIS